MRTLTIEVPEALDSVAREQGRTPEELAQQVLAAWLAERASEAADARVAEQRWAEIQSGAVEGVDWEDVKAEWDALPDTVSP